MTFDIFWFLPISGDTRYLGKSSSGRPVNNAYIRQIATTADVLGYDGLLVPTGSSCLDPFITAASLAPITQQIKFLVALRTSIVGSPTVFARQAATLDEALNGRLLLNVVAGGDSTELAADGVFLEHDERYEATDEFLTLWRRLMAGETISHHGKHYHIENAHNKFSSVQKPYPPLYFGGSSPAAHELAAKQVDVYLTWGEPPALVAEKIKDVRQKAAKLGRTVRFGIRLHVIVRETNAEAWAAADRLIQNLDDATIAKAQEMFANTDSIGQKRMASLHQGKRDSLEISPNLWAGVGLVRGGAGTALVGDPHTIVERMQEYADLGIESFVLSGYPHLEEAVRFAEYVFPLLPGKKPITVHDSSFTGGALDGNSFYNKVRAAS